MQEADLLPGQEKHSLLAQEGDVLPAQEEHSLVRDRIFSYTRGRFS